MKDGRSLLRRQGQFRQRGKPEPGLQCREWGQGDTGPACGWVGVEGGGSRAKVGCVEEGLVAIVWGTKYFEK